MQPLTELALILHSVLICSVSGLRFGGWDDNEPSMGPVKSRPTRQNGSASGVLQTSSIEAVAAAALDYIRLLFPLMNIGSHVLHV